MSATVIPFRGRSSRVAPNEYRDAVELYARSVGAHADIVWAEPPVACWQIRLALNPGDPRCRRQDGEALEVVHLHEYVHPDPDHPSYPRHDPALLKRLTRRHPRTNRLLPAHVPIELDELGMSGIIGILEKGSLLTGRGEFQSTEEALHHLRRHHHGVRARSRADQKQSVRDYARALRRQIFDIAFEPVAIDIAIKRAEKRAEQKKI